MARRLGVPRHRYLVWWSVVFVIAALSGASRVGEWHWRLLELTGARSTYLLLFLAAYLVPVLLWDFWCTPRGRRGRSFSTVFPIAFFTVVGLLFLTVLFGEIYKSFTGPFADYGQRARPLPLWLVREYVEEFLVFAGSYASALAVFAVVRLYWRRAVFFYYVHHTSRRWSRGMALVLGGLAAAGICRMAYELTHYEQFPPAEEPLSLLLLVCMFGLPLVAGLLAWWDRPGTRWPLCAALAISVLTWAVLGFLHMVRFSGMWRFDWTFVVYALVMVVVCGIELVGTVQAIRSDEQAEKARKPSDRDAPGTRRVYPWWMYPVILTCVGLDLYLLGLSVGAQVSYVLVLGLAGATLFLCIAIRRARCGHRSLVPEMAILALILACVTVLLVMASSTCTRSFVRRHECGLRLRAIGLALESYHQQFDSYPPATLVDANGEAIASWRTLLLPYLEEDDLYHTYRLDQPWNSPDNRPVSRSLGEPLFRCATTDGRREDEMRTDYLAIVGEDAFWLRGGRCRRKGEIPHPESTAVLIEVTDSDVCWSEPHDLNCAELLSGAFPWGRTAAHNRTEDPFEHELPYTNVLFADGSVRELGGTPSREELADLVRLDRECPFEEYDDSYRFEGAKPAPHGLHIALFRVWAACFGLVFLYTFLPMSRSFPFRDRAATMAR